MQLLKVVTYNIRKCLGTDRRRDPARVLAVLRELDADIVALQEADRRFGQRASAIPHHMFLENSDHVPVDLSGRPHGIGWHGNAILVRKGSEVRHAQPLPLPTLEPRDAVVAEVKVKGHALRIIGLHLDLSGLWRRRQIRAMLGYLDSAAGAGLFAALPAFAQEAAEKAAETVAELALAAAAAFTPTADMVNKGDFC
jgi:endonuclease/exonuclease/phosphatase family metal-dependent hydrolase